MSDTTSNSGHNATTYSLPESDHGTRTSEASNADNNITIPEPPNDDNDALSLKSPESDTATSKASPADEHHTVSAKASNDNHDATPPRASHGDDDTVSTEASGGSHDTTTPEASSDENDTLQELSREHHIPESTVLASADGAQERFIASCKSLHKQLMQKRSINAKGEMFMPLNEPYDFFSHAKKEVLELFRFAAEVNMPKMPAEQLEKDGNAFIEGVAGSSDTPREQCAAIIFATLLAVNEEVSVKPQSHAWQAFTSACMKKQVLPRFRDRNMPFKDRGYLKKILGPKHGKAFFACQAEYSLPVLRIGQKIKLDKGIPLPYVSEETIGRGFCGTVYAVKIERGHVLHTSTDSSHARLYTNERQKYARKDIQLRDQDESPLTREWDIFELIRRNSQPQYAKYILQTVACFQFEDKLSLFMELARGDLSHFMSVTARPIFPDHQELFRKIFNIAGALDFLHNEITDKDKQYVCYHLDVKPENILVVGSEDNPVFKLADFSISSFKEKNHSDQDHSLGGAYDLGAAHRRHSLHERAQIAGTTSRVGDASTCIAPEALGNGTVNEKSDVWGYACILSIFTAWTCKGNEGVKEFRRMRIEHSQQDDDRFLVTKSTENDSEYSLNEAVTLWLRKECDAIPSDDQSYQEVWRLLVDEMLRIDPTQRSDIKAVHARLKELFQDGKPFRQAVTLAVDGDSHSAARDAASRCSYAHVADNSIEDFIAALKFRNHEESQADVLEKPKDQQPSSWKALQSIFPSASPSQSDKSVHSGRWKSTRPKLIKAFLSDAKEVYTAYLYDDRVTLFNHADEPEESEAITVTSCSEELQNFTLGTEFLCLIPKSSRMQLYLYHMASSFENAAEAFVIESQFQQPELVALHPVHANVVACLFGDPQKHEKHLYVFDVPKRDDLPAVKEPAEADRVKWSSKIDLGSYSKVDLTDSLTLKFSPDGHRLLLLVQKATKDVAARIYSWHSETKSRSHSPTCHEFRNREKDGQTLELTCIAFLQDHAYLTVYNNDQVYITARKDEHVPVAIPPGCKILHAIARPDSTDVYLVAHRGGFELEVIRTVLNELDGRPLLDETSSAVVLGLAREEFNPASCHVMVLKPGENDQPRVTLTRRSAQRELLLLETRR